MKLALIGAATLSILVADATAQLGRNSNRTSIWKTSTWQTLAERYDKDKDGKLTKQEYGRGEAKFARWDSNSDGVLSAADFAAGKPAGGNRRGGNRSGGNRNRGGNGRISPRMSKMVLTRYLALPADANTDKSVSEAEWRKFCDRLDCDKNGIVTKDEMPNAATLSDRAFGAVTTVVDTDRDGKLQVAEIDASFQRLDTDKSKVLAGDELPSRRSGGRRGGGRRGNGLEAGVPRPGEPAPDFDLPLVDQPKGAQKEVTVRLSSFAGKKPVALIFGSYT